MPQFIIANVIAPTFLLADRTEGIFIFIGIILFEWIAIWFFFNKLVKTPIRLLRLLLISLIANIVSSILGVILQTTSLRYAAFNWQNLPVNLVILFFAFIASILIEWRIYIAYIHVESRRWITLKSAIFANSLSYILLIIYVVYISVWLPEAPRFYMPDMEAMSYIGSIFRAQKRFYLENSKFTSSFKQLEELDSKIINPKNTQAEGFYYRYNLSGEQVKVQVTVTPKIAIARGRKLRSYTAVLLAKPKFIYGTCVTKQPSTIAPKPPKLIQNKFQCPSDSEVLEATYGDL
jgi:hypothetical protein